MIQKIDRGAHSNMVKFLRLYIQMVIHLSRLCVRRDITI